MQITRIVPALAVLVLGLAGCAGPDDGPPVASAGSAPPGAGTPTRVVEEDKPLKMAQCMREQGQDWWPDPVEGQGVRIQIPRGADKAKVDAAMEACKEWSPLGGDGPDRVDPALIELARQQSKCMRENGVPKFPDPKPNGQLQIDGDKLGTGPGDPVFDAAEKTCSRFRPSGPPPAGSRDGGPGTIGGGPVGR